MKNHIKKIKRINSSARILGLDIGRKYTGVSVTDKTISSSRALTTLVGDPQLNEPVFELKKQNAVFGAVRKLISQKNVKGIVVGYPLDEDLRPTIHCNYIERWLAHMWSLGIAKRVPVTLVNEYGSSMEAKVQIAEKIQRSAREIKAENYEVLNSSISFHQITTFQSGKNAQLAEHMPTQDPFDAILRTNGHLNPDVLLRKGIYDKVAAAIVLDKFVEFYNSERKVIEK